MEKENKVPGFVRIPGAVLLGAAVFAAFGAIVMLLWNSLMPDIFGLVTIGYWQALGLALLGRFLVGGFGGKKEERREKTRSKKTHWKTQRQSNDEKYEREYEEWFEKEGAGLFEEYVKKNKENE
ncbi:MAG: hypothetical protein WDA65_06185 [Christensenellales bacterium]